ncbi:MAG TPA: VCBS repeat-containing protein [Anaeromyxobacteraceae bacterium]|nr:VCBS repeat-containing protein [Anaeromyxobacteraceae bacterium]
MRRELLGARCGSWAGVLVTLGLTLACGSRGGGGGGGGDGGGDAQTMLQKLGVPASQPRTDSDTLQPLREKTFVFHPDSQLYLSGLTTYPAAFGAAYGGKHQILLDDGLNGFKPLFSTDATDWFTYESTSTAADLRGEGQQEAVVFYRNPTATPAPTAFLRVTGRDVATGQFYEKGPYQIQGNFTFGHPLPSQDGSWNNLQIVAADLDSDGADELVIATGKTVRLLKYDAPSDRFNILDEVSYRPGLSDDQLTTVAAGDVDTDGVPEIVAVNGAYSESIHAQYMIYNLIGGKLVEKESGTVTETNEAGGKDYAFARPSIGDLDGDHINEIAFVGEAPNFITSGMLVTGTQGANVCTLLSPCECTSTSPCIVDHQLAVTVYHHDSKTRTHLALTSKEYAMDSGGMPVAAVFKPDGDPTKNALLANTYVLQLQGSKLACMWGNGSCQVLTPAFGDRVTVGNFNNDGRDGVAYVDAGGYLEIWSYNVQDGKFEQTKTWPLYAYGSTTLTAVNAHRDRNLVLQYKDYELLYSNPRVLAVLVSPPVYQGQDANGTGNTTIEWEAGTQVSTTKAKGFYAGLSLGFEAEAPIWGSAAKEQFKLNVDVSMDWNFTDGGTQSVATSFFTGSGEDQVVFVSVPYDIYHYTVVSSPDGKAGYDLAIQVPRNPVIKQFDLDLFNSIVPEAYRVPDQAFNPATGKRHAAYDPWSYATHAEM